MQTPFDETGIIGAFLEKLEKQSLPRALSIKQRIDEGERLNEIDIVYFEDMLSEAGAMMPMLQHHPEYQKLTGELANLYHEIIQKALKNETCNP